MATDPTIPTFRPGDPLTARDLNAITSRLRKVRSGPRGRVIDSEAGVVLEDRGRGPAPRRTFFARVTGSQAVAGQPNRWTYSWAEVIKSAAGYAGWTDRPTGRTGPITGTGTARNLMEEMNSGAGVQGHGVNIDPPNFPSGYATKPCPTGQIVLMSVVRLANGTDTEYWFEHHNAVDGSCSG